MSDYSKLSDDELNEAIAVKNGWVFSECIDCHHEYWITPDGAVDYNESDPPDYTHDWRLAGELLEEMRASLCFDGDTGLWECEYFTQYGEDEIHRFVRANTPQRAICEAWLAWKGQE